MKTLKNIVVFMSISILLISCSSSDDENSNGCEECEYTIQSGETADTVPDELLGEYNLVLQYSQNGYSFPDGTTAKFTISQKELIVEIEGEECLVLKNPTASANQVEFSFRDTCRDNIMYAASISSNGGLNEINVGAINGSFYGQFH